ncbi:MAG: hypothetical protein LBR70_01570 [Lactobacillaceae bacterium]|jgi:ketopantoate reductase|nr:hypothetical protein [Lactobacillaceae bacterium]
MFFKKKKKEEQKEDIIELTELAGFTESGEISHAVEELVVEETIHEIPDTEEPPPPSIDDVLSRLEEAYPKEKDGEETEDNAERGEESTEDKEEEQGFALLDGKEAIYILGDNALAVYLAIRFINSGEKVILIPNKETASTFSNNGVTLVENHNLQKSHHKFDTTFWLKETPKMLIITSEASKINAAITSISRKKVEDVPVVLLTPVRDIQYIKNILGNDIYRAFFDGYLLQRPTQINLYGRAPSITICAKGNEKRNNTVKDYFEKAGFGIKTEKDEIKAFWEYFTVYTACSLISAAYNKNIFDVIKDKDKRDKMIPLISEICLIAKNDGAKIDQEEILKKIYNTPLSYPYPLQVAVAQGKAGDIDMIGSNLISAARKYKITMPETSILLKKIYNIIMA